MTFDLESLHQEDSIWPWLENNLMADMNYVDENYNADLLDAMADMAYEQEQARRESLQNDWSYIDHTYDTTSIDLINQQTTWKNFSHDNNQS